MAVQGEVEQHGRDQTSDEREIVRGVFKIERSLNYMFARKMMHAFQWNRPYHGLHFLLEGI